MRNHRMMAASSLLCGALAVSITFTAAAAQESAPASPPAAEGGPAAHDDAALAQQLSNPVADLASIPFQFNWENGVGPNDDLRLVVNVQPVVPFKLTPKWNLIGRFILPYINQPSLGPGVPATSGTGDILVSGFFTPAQPKRFIWGIGPALNLPTNTDPGLGSGQWGAGPTVLVLVITGPWTYGFLANHVWGFADTGDVERGDLSNTFIQPFLAHQFPHAVTLTLQSESTYNWEADDANDWTVPINLLLSKVTRLGQTPLSLGIGAGYYVESPEIGPAWKIRAVATVILPSKK